MQKPNNEFVETVLMAIPADMLEEVGIEPCSTVQMHVSRLKTRPVASSRSSGSVSSGSVSSGMVSSVAEGAGTVSSVSEAPVSAGSVSVASG